MEKKYLDYEGLIEVFKIIKQRDTQLESDVTLILNGMASQLEQKADKDELKEVEEKIPTDYVSQDELSKELSIIDTLIVRLSELEKKVDEYHFKPYLTLLLRNNWQENTYSDVNLDGYEIFESFSNYHINSGKSKMKIYVNGDITKTFNFKYRSDAENTYDYLVISKLDNEIPSGVTYSNAYSNASIEYYTRGKQNEWFDAEYVIPEGEHFIEILYIKNSLTNTEPDRGFIAIQPKEIITISDFLDNDDSVVKIKGKFTDSSTNTDWYILGQNINDKVNIAKFVNPQTKEFDFSYEISPSMLFQQTKIEVIDDVKIPVNTTDTTYLFSRCNYLTSISLPSIDTQSVTKMNYMFDRNPLLHTINFGDNFDLNSVTSVSSMFLNDTALTTVTGNISNLKISLDLSACPLTKDSALVFLNGLAKLSSTQTITFNKSTFDLFTGEELAPYQELGWTIVGS